MERGFAFGSDVLGYSKSKGVLTVNEDEAPIVRKIFSKYCDDGKGLHMISKELEDEGIKTKKGNSRWTSAAVSRILKNEKYAGDLVQRKTYTTDCLTHEKKYNNGEVELIIQRNHHEPIVSRDTFDRAQAELARRGEAAREHARYTIRYPFSGKVKCGLCGMTFVSRKRENRKTQLAWKCLNNFKYGKVKENAQGEARGCNNPSVSDELLQQVFLHSLNDVVKDKEGIIIAVEKAVIAAIGETTGDLGNETAIKRDIAALERKQDVLLDARLENEISKEDFKKKKAALDAQLEILNARLEENEKQKQLLSRQDTLIDSIKSSIRTMVSAEVFSGEVCKSVLDKIVVHSRSEFDVHFKGLQDPYFFCNLGAILSRQSRLPVSRASRTTRSNSF